VRPAVAAAFAKAHEHGMTVAGLTRQLAKSKAK
jgi:hypothetical protein